MEISQESTLVLMPKSELKSLVLDCVNSCLKWHNANVVQSHNPHERLTRAQVKDQFKISYATIHGLMRSGKLAYEKIGKKTIFKRECVENYFNDQRRDSKS